jgi:hypothetical protein
VNVSLALGLAPALAWPAELAGIAPDKMKPELGSVWKAAVMLGGPLTMKCPLFLTLVTWLPITTA